MATNALRSHGTTLQIGDGGSPTENFTAIAEVKSITGPTLDKSSLDATTHSSGGWKEKLGGVHDAGTLTFNVNYIPTDPTQSFSSASLSSLGKDYVSNVRRNFKLIFPDSGHTTWGFSAFVKSFHVSAPVDGILDGSITVEVTGAPTLS